MITTPTDAQSLLREAIVQTRSAIDQRTNDLVDLQEQVQTKLIERSRLERSLKNLERNFEVVLHSDLDNPDT